MKCPCENCLIVGRCRRMVPDEVVKKCDLVCKYLEMTGPHRSVTFLVTSLGNEEKDRRMARIIQCLHLEHNGGCYIGSSPSEQTLEDGRQFCEEHKAPTV